MAIQAKSRAGTGERSSRARRIAELISILVSLVACAWLLGYAAKKHNEAFAAPGGDSALAQFSDTPYFIVSPQSGRILGYNAAAERLFSLSAEKLIGRDFSDFRNSVDWRRAEAGHSIVLVILRDESYR